MFEAALVPFEITACNLIIHYWSMLFSVRFLNVTLVLTQIELGDIVPAGGIIAIVIVLYG